MEAVYHRSVGIAHAKVRMFSLFGSYWKYIAKERSSVSRGGQKCYIDRLRLAGLWRNSGQA